MGRARWRRKGEYDILFVVALKSCVVSFRDSEGFRHAVEIDAESLYEATLLAAQSFAEHGCPPGFAHQIEIEVRPPAVVHMVTLNRVREWVQATARSPKERVLKQRLKDLLAQLPVG